MRAILIFNLPKEENDFRLALGAGSFFDMIYMIHTMVRGYLRGKNHEYKNAEELLEDILKICSEVVFFKESKE